MPHEFPGFKILTEAGRGNTGIVYRAVDLRINREVGLKVLIAGSVPERDHRASRFLREARVMVSLTPDPNIPAVHAVEKHLGQPYLVREFVDGVTFQYGVANGLITALEGVDICGTIAGTLARIHQRGLVHRNLYPENILIARDGTPKLIGFSRATADAEVTNGPASAKDVQSLQATLDWLFTAVQKPWPHWLESVRPPKPIHSAEELKQRLTFR